MKQFIYSLRDTKADAFAQPFFAPNRSVAIRNYLAASEDPASIISRFPGDFSLYEIGLFDDNTGIIESHPLPQLISPTQG
ncbi:MAG: nonstructural protein [Microvirus sp.]|nr:MAG: nonstructural protein [Microvirus sp.]